MRLLLRNENYMVNEFGEVYSIKRNKILTPKINHDGYLRIQLWKNGSCEFVGIHRLIAETFISNPDNKTIVNHKDGNKQNNVVENLEWCTQKENIRHSFDMGLSKQQTYNTSKLCKKVRQYTIDGEFIKEFPSIIEVNRQLKIARCGIINCCIGKAKTAGGFKWEYVESLTTIPKGSTSTIDTLVEVVGTL